MRWFDDEVAGATVVVLELRAADRIGLLHSVASALERCGADVLWARVSTLGGTVVDSFAVTANGAAPAPAWRREVEKAVVEAAG